MARILKKYVVIMHLHTTVEPLQINQAQPAVFLKKKKKLIFFHFFFVMSFYLPFKDS